MPPTGIPLDDSSVIDISHESLIRGWKRLRKWVDEEADLAKVYRRLAQTAALHAQGTAGLWHDPDLEHALAWRDKEHPNAAWAERYDPGFDAGDGVPGEEPRRARSRAARRGAAARPRAATRPPPGLRHACRARRLRNLRRLFLVFVAAGGVSAAAGGAQGNRGERRRRRRQAGRRGSAGRSYAARANNCSTTIETIIDLAETVDRQLVAARRRSMLAASSKWR